MNIQAISRRASLGTALAALAVGIAAVAAPAPALAQPRAYASGSYRPSMQVLLSVGEGQMINLPRSVSNVWTSNPDVADVYVNGPRQMNLFGKKAGQATVIATDSGGSVVYGANVRVNQNISSINEIVHQAMPDSDISVTTVGQVAVINGTVSSPEDAAQAEMLVKAALNPGIDITAANAPLSIVPVSRLKVATPLQVMLKVRVAEMNRSAVKQFGVNLLSHDSTGGTLFGIGQGTPGTINTVMGAPNPVTGLAPESIQDVTFNNLAGGTTLGIFGKLLGLNVLGTLDLLENDGVITTLAEPNLTALSGETASFLAGGEFPIPVSQSLGAVTIEYKQYGVGLAFTPVVLADGRISLRVRPEVSQLSDAGSVKLNGFTVPALTTRRAETTVELGSGQSFMIAGLLQNSNTNSIQKAPFLGDIPVLGTLFRSTKFQRDETELVIIVTPYLVKPVSGQLATPADGYRAPNDIQENLLGQSYTGTSGAVQPNAIAARPTAPVTGPVAAPGFKL
ncbi:MAG TPA: type II and III secretion system protein family protein [Sphingomicrobium sp.]|jgi:pilus assembly protein CpaC|nr:type II and III secretion system protein family protein [Sphingomicrobium sp.]